MPVALFDTATPLAAVRDRLHQRLIAVVDSGTYILGPELHAFEAELGAHLGVAHVVGVANGTDALTIALRAMGIGAGDDVVVPSFTFYASAEAIPPTGARPVFCDVDPDTLCATPDTVRAALTPATRAVIAVDLFGNVAPTPQIEALGVPVLEDAAQAAGSTLDGRAAGALGTAATFSFFPSKNLPCLGDGGAIATDDDGVAAAARMLRFHGSRDKRTFEEVGCNSRLDEIQAAVLRVLLGELDGWAAGRRAAGDAYVAAGLGEHVALPRPVAGAAPAWHLYVVRHARAQALAEELEARGVGARRYYPTPVHRQPAMARWAFGTELPVTEALTESHVALPMSPVLGPADAAEVTAAVADALGAIAEGLPR